jgi:hypothetical protein
MNSIEKRIERLEVQETLTAGGTPVTRTISTTAPLTIDGGASADLSANRTIAIAPAPATHALMGPVSGADAAPAFRALVAGDVPALPYLPMTAINSTTGDFIRYNAVNGHWETAAEPIGVKGIVLTPALASLVDAEGAIYYNSSIKSVMVCTDI